MDFTNAFANNKGDLQDEDLYYDEEESVEGREFFKHNVYEGKKVSWMEEEMSPSEKFEKVVVTLDVIPSL